MFFISWKELGFFSKFFNFICFLEIGNNPMRAGQQKTCFFLVMRCFNLMRAL